MTVHDELIHCLAAKPEAVPCPHPARLLLLWLTGALFAGIGATAVTGLRQDLALRLTEPLYLAELLSLAVLIVTTALAALWLGFPDQRQQRWVLWSPLGPFLLTVGLFFIRALNATPPETDHALNCGLCILLSALAPAAVLLLLIRRYATVTPRRAGTYALLAAASIGQLVLKLAETDDSIEHLAVGHLLPILILGWFGGWLGRKLLVW